MMPSASLLALLYLCGEAAAYTLGGGACRAPGGCAARHAASAAAQMVMTPPEKEVPLDELVPATASWTPPVPWEVHKFGGASLATAELYMECSDLLISESQKGLERDGAWAPTMVVVSAKGGVTDKLIQVVNAALTDMAESARLLRVVAEEQMEVVRKIADVETAAEVEARIRADEEDILMVVRAVSLIKTVPATTMELVTGYGEVWSAQTMHAYFRSKAVPSAWLDAREVLVVENTGGEGLGNKGSSNVMGVDPVWSVTAQRVSAWWADPARDALRAVDFSEAAPIVVVTGFVAALASGTPTTLKRSGSDYSATIFARLMAASRITMWKNVNGVYTADPRRVPEAFPITSLKFDEAIELAYFGAQVLHPSAMTPCIEGKIPIYVRNVFNPAHPGTVIEGRACSLSWSSESFHVEKSLAAQPRKAACQIPLGDNDSPIRGITSVDGVALVTLEGTSLVNVPDVSHRLFGTLLAANVQPVMVTQASADSSICVVVPDGDAERVEAFLNEAFEMELRKGGLASVSVEHGLSVVAIVGEGMAFRPGVGATFAKSMANAGVNIRAIAQGSSERQISLVVDKEDCTRALRAAHAALALSNSQLSVGVIGATGQVGSALLEQLKGSGLTFTACDAAEGQAGRTAALDELRVDLKVTALCNSRAMVLSYDGVCPSAAEGLSTAGDAAGEAPPAAGAAEEADLARLTDFVTDDYNGNRVVIDCTSSAEVSAYYDRWLEAGVHVITANKKVGSGPYEQYEACVRHAKSSAQWLYETTGPGSGLPVLSTLKDMVQSGDTIRVVEGVFSGTLSYLLSSVAQRGVPFSAALRTAAAEGFCEPDPRDDISFLDVRRKTVVIARELGLRLELDDVQCEDLMPAELQQWQPDAASDAPLIEQLAAALEPFDAALAARVAAAEADGMALAPIGRVDVTRGVAEVRLEALPKGSRLTNIEGNDNIIAIHSARYAAQPLVIQGPGAGAEITASGLFADLLSLSRSIAEWTIPKIQG